MSQTFIRNTLALLLSVVAIDAQSHHSFTENKGQWRTSVEFRADIPNGAMFLERTGITYSFMDYKAISDAHSGEELPETIKAHGVKVEFVNASDNPIIEKGIASDNYSNYFIGNDPSKWASNVRHYDAVKYRDVYPGISFKIYSKDHGIKYDFIVEPQADPDKILVKYHGAESIRLTDAGNIEIQTSLSKITEMHPYAYQFLAGVRKTVQCDFYLKGNQLSFVFPEGYDEGLPLIIDPELVFATYSGSEVLNFGSSACNDSDGRLIGAGTTFGAGYPTTVGAYQLQPGPNVNGTADIGITKFTPDGSNLLFSTYLGGSGNDVAHSTVVNAQGDICILGTSVSADFPVTANAFQDTNYRGQQTINFGPGYAMSYQNGCDIIVARLSADGTQLIGSTYFGGSGNDGINFSGSLNYNYGDPFRGEINVDQQGNMYIASCTESSDLPIPSNAAQPTFGGQRDGVVAKFNPDLSNIIWASYAGGTGVDNAYAIQLSENGQIAVAGGTESTSFPTTNGVNSPVFLGGGGDGWVMKIAPDGSAFEASTFVGSSGFDQVYFVQFDEDNNIYVLGQTTGNIPVYPSSVFNNPNSGQFIQRFDNNLTSVNLSTTVGTSSGEVDISPTAFLVSNCNQIYLSGWGGSSNNDNGNTVASTTTGLPVTADAFQATTDGDDFYLMVLGENASDLVYATFFGGTVSEEHVDGGTSRFDKNGVVYQAVCAGCGNHNDFPTTPDAWSATNNAGCNLGVFKFDLNRIISSPDLSVALGNCTYPISVEFTNNSSGANTFVWEFGDGSQASVFDTTHLYDQPGEYEVILTASDSLDCLTPDTAIISFSVPIPPVIQAFGTDTICALDTAMLSVISDQDVEYTWRPITDSLIIDSDTLVTIVTETTTFTVLAIDSLGCQAQDEVTVHVSEPLGIDAGTDAYTEPGNPAQLITELQPSDQILWFPSSGLSCTTCPDPLADPDETTMYYLEVTNELGCVSLDSVLVNVYPTIYVPNAFTPGPNTANPIFYVYGHGIHDFNLTIFNRWGQKVFESNDLSSGWNGSFSGTDSPQGVYVWSVTYTTDIRPKLVQKDFGHVTLLRDMNK